MKVNLLGHYIDTKDVLLVTDLVHIGFGEQGEYYFFVKFINNEVLKIYTDYGPSRMDEKGVYGKIETEQSIQKAHADFMEKWNSDNTNIPTIRLERGTGYITKEKSYLV